MIDGKVAGTNLSPPPPMQLQDEARKQEQLDRMKMWATSLLLLASAVFVVARIYEGSAPWVGFLRATAEAAMVGALADWFAVTALFRYPLGLPIPHTAIIPNRKDQIGRSLGRFVENNFLKPDILSERLRSADAAGRLAEWGAVPENARRVADALASGIAGAVQVLRDEDVEALIERTLARRVRETEAAPLVGNVLSVVATSDLRQEILDGVVRLLANLFEENRAGIRDRIDQELPWWVPTPIDEKIYRKVTEAIERTLADLQAHPDHPLRVRFDDLISRFVEDLKSSPDVIARGEEIKEDLLAHPGVQTFSKRVWEELRQSLIDSTGDASELRDPLVRGIQRFSAALHEDAALRGKVNGWAEHALVHVAESYRHEVGQLISQTVGQWDPRETSKKIELQVGKDLQFIRINGTVVGGLAGLVIHTISLWL
jgi:uncharacterized membrane-anchored protein YjiN (DUF445 family)